MKWFAKRLLGKAMGFSACVIVLALIERQVAGQCVEQKLLASDGATLDEFGYVSISGDIAIVGAGGGDQNRPGPISSSAYIFRKSGAIWEEEANLVASIGAADDRFGVSVSIIGPLGNEVAIVGADLDDDNGTNSGAAYIFRKSGSTWVREQKLLALDGTANNQFGWSVSISGDSAIVGANWDDENGRDAGAAYVFELTACTADTNCSGEVNVSDLLMLLGNWGSCPAPCPPDTNGDGTVNVTDLLDLLAAWGPCP